MRLPEQYTMEKRSELFDLLQSKKLYIKYNGHKIPAIVQGRNLDYPVIRTVCYPDIDCEINWRQVERLATGIFDCIIF